MVSLYRRKGDPRWTIAYRDPRTGRRVERVAYRDKRASQQLAAEIELRLERQEVGLVDPFLEHRKRPVAEHLDGFEAHLQSRGRTAKHVRMSRARLEAALAGMAVATLGELDPAAADRFLAQLRKDGRSAKTRDDYAAILRQFGAWLVDAGRWGENPFAKLGRTRTAADATFERRALTIDELRRLIAAAPQRSVQAYVTRHPGASAETIAELRRAGERRAVLYALAAFTGLRENECRQLRWNDLDLDGDPPTVRVRAATAKNRKTELVPLHADLVELLRTERKRSAADLGRPVRGAEAVVHVPRWVVARLRADAAWAGLGTLEKGYSKHAVRRLTDDEGRRLDFHSLRATAATMLARAGVPLQQAQRLLRHSDPRITERLYTKLGLADLADGVAKLPGLDEGQAAESAARPARRGAHGRTASHDRRRTGGA